MTNIIVRFNFDRWEVVRKYGYRENLLASHTSEKDAREDAAWHAYADRVSQGLEELAEGLGELEA